MSKSLLAALALTVACGPAAAQAYKWVDANGRTHFSDTPPPERKAEKMTIRPQLPADGQAAARQPDWQAQLQESNLRNAQAQREQEAAESDRKRALRDCAIARDHLAILTQGGRVYSRGESGEKQYLEDKDRPAAVAAAQQRVDRHCR